MTETIGVAELYFGPLGIEPSAYSASSLYRIEVSPDDIEWGSASAVVDVVQTLLRDGSLTEVTRWDNRSASLLVRVSAGSYDGLAAGEQALMEQVNAGRNTLTWIPPQDDAIPTVFDVLVSELALQYNIEQEQELIRTYVLTLTCLPFARSVDQSSVPGVASGVPVAPTDIDTVDSNSDSRWSAPFGTGFGVGLGQAYVTSVVANTGGPGPSAAATLRRTLSTSLSGSTFLVVTTSATAADARVTFEVDGVPVSPSLTYAVGGSVVNFLPVSGSTFTTLTAKALRPAVTASFVFSVLNVARASSARLPGSGREQLFTVPVLGSARTQGSLEIYAGSDLASGVTLASNVLLYTRKSSPGNLPPNLRPWITASSSPTVNTSLYISGSVHTISTGVPTVFRVPAAKLDNALYALMIAAAGDHGTTTLTWSAQLVKAGASTALGAAQSGTFTIASTTHNVYDVGRLLLPPLRVDPQSTHELMLTFTVSAEMLVLDEAWLFNLDDGDLSWVQPGAGVQALRVNAPDLDNPRPEFGIADTHATWGTTGRNADAMVKAWGAHEWDPGAVDVFAVCSTVQTAQVNLAYFRRWHTHARP